MDEYPESYLYSTPKVIYRLKKQLEEENMGKELKPKDDYVMVDVGVKVRRDLLKKSKNEAGYEIIEYDYWDVITRTETFKITDPDDYERICKAVNNADILFIDVNGNLVRKGFIDIISEQKTDRKAL